MDNRTWVRAAGVAAAAGGVARIASPLAARMAPDAAQAAYLAIDIALTLGMIGFYARWAGPLGRLGLAIFAVCLAGVLTVRSQGAVPGAYMIGAAIWALGMAALGLRLLFVAGGPRVAPALWLAAAAAGLAGPVGLLAAGSLFGLGFVAAGVGLLRREPPQ